MADFNARRFKGFNYENESKKYWKFNTQVNDDESKVLVKVANSNLFSFYSNFNGWLVYGLKLDRNHLVFLKNWQVFEGAYGTYILIDKNYWNVKDARKPFDDMVESADLSFEAELQAAKDQQEAADEILVAKN